MSTDTPEPDHGEDPTAPGGDAVDPTLNTTVMSTIRKILTTDGGQLGVTWMDAETANHINSAMGAANSQIQMEMMRQGLPIEAATYHAQHQLLLLAFELGRRVGIECEATRQMREMFGDDF